jgi:hypothetical protein
MTASLRTSELLENRRSRKPASRFGKGSKWLLGGVGRSLSPLGRKNWIHIGSEEAGPRVAAILSIVETCRRLKIPVRDYLGSVLPGLGDFPINRIAELTPAAWATRN